MFARLETLSLFPHCVHTRCHVLQFAIGSAAGMNVTTAASVTEESRSKTKLSCLFAFKTKEVQTS